MSLVLAAPQSVGDLTTFAGLTPIILERSVQAQFLIPMALSLGFGVLFATFITLIIIPCNYVILDDIHRLLGRRKTPESVTDDKANDFVI